MKWIYYEDFYIKQASRGPEFKKWRPGACSTLFGEIPEYGDRGYEDYTDKYTGATGPSRVLWLKR